jgi:diaminopimelate decarboxylase
LRPSLYGSYHEIIPVRRSGPSSKKRVMTKKTDVVGPVCETGDCFASDRKLPTHLNQGDLVAILSAGAYGFAMAGNYNSRPRPAEVMVHDGQIRIIRERETYEDLIRGESW